MTVVGSRPPTVISILPPTVFETICFRIRLFLKAVGSGPVRLAMLVHARFRKETQPDWPADTGANRLSMGRVSYVHFHALRISKITRHPVAIVPTVRNNVRLHSSCHGLGLHSIYLNTELRRMERQTDP
jgi:hypothetical protein